jgi:Zn-dependent protease
MLVLRARQAAARGNFAAALADWQTILGLLPAEAPERAGVQREIDRLQAKLNHSPAKDWRKRLGPIGVVIAALAKFKGAIFLFLTKGKYLFSMLAFIGLYWALFGWLFAIGFFATIFIHEMGHYIVIKRYGLKPSLPMFLPGLGAYVAWQGGAVSPAVRANISLAGPLFGFLSGLLAMGLYFSTGQRAWLAVAQVAGFINLFNLAPLGFLDGGKAMDAISTAQRFAILVLSVALLFIVGMDNFLPWFVLAAATAYRLYRRDVTEPHELTGYYFAAIAIANGLLSWYCINIAHIHRLAGYQR